MIKIKEVENNNPEIISLDSMRPWEVGYIVDSDTSFHNDIIMRTASLDKFEVMNLSKPGEWFSEYACLRVHILHGYNYDIILTNDNPPPKNRSHIFMWDMKPLQIGIIEVGDYYYYVMRTANPEQFEVMNLTLEQPNACWLNPTEKDMVSLLTKEESFIFQI